MLKVYLSLLFQHALSLVRDCERACGMKRVSILYSIHSEHFLAGERLEIACEMKRASMA